MRLRSAKPTPVSPQASSALEKSTRTPRRTRASSAKGRASEQDSLILPVTAQASSSRDISADVVVDQTDMELDDGLSDVDSSIEKAELEETFSRRQRRNTRQMGPRPSARKRDESDPDILDVDSDSSFNVAVSDDDGEDESEGLSDEKEGDDSDASDNNNAAHHRGRSRPASRRQTPRSRRPDILSNMIVPEPTETQGEVSASLESNETVQEAPAPAAPQARRRAPARRRARTQKEKVEFHLKILLSHYHI